MIKLKQIYYTLLVFVFVAVSNFALSFPVLTGRVVDNANIISASTRGRLAGILQNIEDQTTDQVVVVTVPNLENKSIEDYGYQLGRYWGIGQKEKDNGVLIIVALKERSVRIEVGYGLEDQLTDAVTASIIRDQMVPYLKEKNYDQAIQNAVDKIGEILLSKTSVSSEKSSKTRFLQGLLDVFFILLFGYIWFFFCGGSTGSGDGSTGSGGGGSFGGGGSSGKF